MKEYFSKDNKFIGPTIILGLAFLAFAFIVNSSINNFTNRDQNIAVTGTAERFVKSDTAKWTITVSERAFGEGAGVTASKNTAKSI